MDFNEFDKLERGGEDPPEVETERQRWRSTEAPSWAIPIEQLRMHEARLEKKLTPRVYGPDGKQTLGSELRRSTEIVAILKLENGGKLKGHPSTYEELRKRPGFLKPLGAEDLARQNQAMEIRFHEQTQTALAAMGLGARAIETLADLTVTPAVEWTRAWLEKLDSRWALILSGVGGSGKTIALADAMYQYARETVRYSGHVEPQWRAKKARYVLASDFTTGPAWGSDAVERVRELVDVPLLCFDDLGAEPVTEASQNLLFMLLDGRYRQKRKTLIGTNLTPEELVVRYGKRYGRRFSHDRNGEASLRTARERVQVQP